MRYTIYTHSSCLKNPHSIGFRGGRPLPFTIPLKLCWYYAILGHQLH